VWPELQERVGTLDFRLVFRRKGAVLEDDTGLVLMPKLFRRLAEHAVNKKAKMLTAGSHAFSKRRRTLASKPASSWLKASLLNSASSTSSSRGTAPSCIGRKELVFKDAPSTLVVPAGGSIDW
jgi:hypothetical protein